MRSTRLNNSRPSITRSSAAKQHQPDIDNLILDNITRTYKNGRVGEVQVNKVLYALSGIRDYDPFLMACILDRADVVDESKIVFEDGIPQYTDDMLKALEIYEAWSVLDAYFPSNDEDVIANLMKYSYEHNDIRLLNVLADNVYDMEFDQLVTEYAQMATDDPDHYKILEAYVNEGYYEPTLEDF